MAPKKQRKAAPAAPADAVEMPDAENADGQTQQAPAPAPAPAPKRSHHRQTGQLRVPLPLTWERVNKPTGCAARLTRCEHGIRKRVPKSVREAASKNAGFRGELLRLRSTHWAVLPILGKR